ncbi:domain of Kin17 curved DNA-binding protein-domain-containing protein [Scheffersomyces amazonensis]|uniref:domain of Kin17 curved DNA-binding protein-domain-containing protein n=1 Tax=Scheffersomyces amazonensis TaxID=1078765 RepID=UPI00315DF134
MARAEIGSVKYQSKKLKASGLQKLRYYCQICSKQCRDENGFKNHVASPSHRGKVSTIDSSTIQNYSSKFQTDFLNLLRVNHGTKRINANKFYQEYILNDKNHIHMNTTKWNSLTSFIKHLGQAGLVRVENENPNQVDEFNLVITLVDQKLKYEKKQQGQSSKSIKNDEELSMKFINQQIKRGKEVESVQSPSPRVEPVIKELGPIKLALKSRSKGPVARPSVFDNDDD